MKKRIIIIVGMLVVMLLFIACAEQEETLSDNDNTATPTVGLIENEKPTLSPTPTKVPSPTPTKVPSPTLTSTPSPTPTATPMPAAHTIYDGTIVELSEAKVGDVVLLGTYEQDNIKSNGAEAIPWYVLDKDGDKLLLMSVYLLDCVPYLDDDEWRSITWEDCTLRQWMNDVFYNRAFTEVEKKYIQMSYLETADDDYGSHYTITADKVFALSSEETEQYFWVTGEWSIYHELFAAKVTAYAEAQGVGVGDYETTAGCGWWWLRSPGGSEAIEALAENNGGVHKGSTAVIVNGAARPTLWLDLNPAATTPTVTPSSAPTATPVSAAHTIYDGTIVELSKAKVGDVVLFGSYEQDNIESNGAEAIPWYVLDKDGDKLLLMSVYLLDGVPYHEVREAITWKDCTLRQWMNDDFYNRAFTESEKIYVQMSYLKNADNPYYGTEGGNDTEDKVFALSSEEAKQYFGIVVDYGSYWVSASPELSAAKVTEYAEAQGADVSYGCWWLRSSGLYSDYAVNVNSVNSGGDVGVVYEFGDLVDFSDYAVRPALWLNLNP